LELRNWGGNASKQLAQGCYPMEEWRDPETEPGYSNQNQVYCSWVETAIMLAY